MGIGYQTRRQGPPVTLVVRRWLVVTARHPSSTWLSHRSLGRHCRQSDADLAITYKGTLHGVATNGSAGGPFTR